MHPQSICTSVGGNFQPDRTREGKARCMEVKTDVPCGPVRDRASCAEVCVDLHRAGPTRQLRSGGNAMNKSAYRRPV